MISPTLSFVDFLYGTHSFVVLLQPVLLTLPTELRKVLPSIMKLITHLALGLSLLLAQPSSILGAAADYDRYGDRDGSVTAYLADIDSIRHTINKYALALDSKQYDLLDPLFTNNSTWSSPSFGTIVGVAALKDVTRRTTGNASTQHIFANDVLEVNTKAGTATGTVYLLDTVYGLLGPTVTNVINGYFKDTFVRTKKGKHYPQLEWRFKSRQFVPLVRSHSSAKFRKTDSFPNSSPLTWEEDEALHSICLSRNGKSFRGRSPLVLPLVHPEPAEGQSIVHTRANNSHICGSSISLYICQ